MTTDSELDLVVLRQGFKEADEEVRKDDDLRHMAMTRRAWFSFQIDKAMRQEAKNV